MAVPLSLSSAYSVSKIFLPFFVELHGRAFAFAVFETHLQLLLAVGIPGFPNAVFFAGGVMLLGLWLLSGVVVGDPIAIAQAIFEPRLACSVPSARLISQLPFGFPSLNVALRFSWPLSK